MFIKEYGLKINNADEILKKLDDITASLEKARDLIFELSKMGIDFRMAPMNELQEDSSNEVEQE